jgi:hypothetical protein
MLHGGEATIYLEGPNGDTELRIQAREISKGVWHAQIVWHQGS